MSLAAFKLLVPAAGRTEFAINSEHITIASNSTGTLPGNFHPSGILWIIPLHPRRLVLGLKSILSPDFGIFRPVSTYRFHCWLHGEWNFCYVSFLRLPYKKFHPRVPFGHELPGTANNQLEQYFFIFPPIADLLYDGLLLSFDLYELSRMVF